MPLLQVFATQSPCSCFRWYFTGRKVRQTLHRQYKLARIYLCSSRQDLVIVRMNGKPQNNRWPAPPIRFATQPYFSITYRADRCTYTSTEEAVSADSVSRYDTSYGDEITIMLQCKVVSLYIQLEFVPNTQAEVSSGILQLITSLITHPSTVDPLASGRRTRTSEAI